MRIVPQVTWLPGELDAMGAIAAATLDDSARLLEANAGLLRILPDIPPDANAADLNYWFVQPNFDALKAAVARAPDLAYKGLLTVGPHQGNTRALKAWFWRVDAHWHLLAEHDIDELERVCATVLSLNQEYAFAQARLAQANYNFLQREQQIVGTSLSDPLTGVGNRRRLEQALPLELSRSQRRGEQLCAIMCDIDHFKRINDEYGHVVGDKVLVGIGRILLGQLRPTDIVTRFGGEEFVVLIPNTGIESVVESAERLRTTIEALRIEPVRGPITASFGVADLQDGEQSDSLPKRIDGAMYAAKASGRNRVERA